ncbi:hypothetical protein RASY3_07600 [Ruminococcus albus SY3]|uniref:Cell surface protein n=1 Tax=Ruminococcus albus SY3 TaxID=1341156 RepID=A0A011VY24_RUMAL|nr:leucine-rich repeat domain-containing protein [Ruminococcus albus]EXM40186.1 hypothetical protein RASY3_07600 [Ruminococcus albus SY3]
MKSKKIISGLLALTFVLGGAAIPGTVVDNSVVASAAEVLTYGDYEYTINGGTAEITKYTGTDEVVEIPGEINGAAVTSIGEKAFVDCETLFEVTIPDGVVNLDSHAFHNCYRLIKVSMPDSVETLGRDVFSYCRALKSVTLSKNLKSLSYRAFYGCNELADIQLPSAIKTIDDEAFRSCSNMENIDLPEGLESIGKDAFRECAKLSAITIPDSVTYLGSFAFLNCSALADVKLSVNLTEICISTFQNCKSLESIVIPEGVTKLDYGAFYSAENLKRISLPESLKTISLRCFSGCKKLEELTIPASVESIDKNAFGTVNVINCYNGSVAEKVALANGINIKVIDAKDKTEYPDLKSAQFDSKYHQFRINWTKVEGAQQYGIAVNLAGKWKVQAYTDANTTTFTSPKLKSGSKYDMAICAKVNGKWETTDFTKRAFTIAVK